MVDIESDFHVLDGEESTPEKRPPQICDFLSCFSNRDSHNLTGESSERKQPKAPNGSTTSTASRETQEDGEPNGLRPDVASTSAAASSKLQGEETRSFKCQVCGKAYSNHNALGGHIAGHNNKKNHPSAGFATADGEGAAAKKRPKVSVLKPSGKSHVCEICGKSFLNGQALGGHKRIHADHAQALSTNGNHSSSWLSLSLSPTSDETSSDGGGAGSKSKGAASSNHEWFGEIALGLCLGRSIDQPM